MSRSEASNGAAAGHPGAGPRGVLMVLTGTVLGVLMLVLGLTVRTSPVAALDLRIDRHIALQDRVGWLTTLATAVSQTATPETVGIGLMTGLPLLLLLLRRRLDALRVFCAFGGAFALAEIGKRLIGEQRPPASLWAMPAGGGASYPSGHVTTAAVLVIAIVAVSNAAVWRYTAVVLGAGYVLAVAASRIYLADHYPPDVIGSVLCALAAVCVVDGLLALTGLKRRLQPG
ncbi:MAG: phosphatase PAP2 family protein [Streptosporangiaceae bacterium]|nr:phosphatase PAP2 family protein [Streptosporangiaceae bacterium]